ncbi:MAG TPA: LuxR C-terminal-related transcriptional regulator, partial [Candidatus Binatia bacterium]|nr:LuxR C-terminal-related transcriptional regulator [Candidatus Binatia bacterium]
MSSDEGKRLIEPLTQRERDILLLLAQGKSNREMAEALVLSVHTVKWYNRQVFGKLGVANREEAGARARALGLVTDEKQGERRAKNLAPTTPLIGREAELRELKEIILHSSSRLVSIVGPGGIGKTHLAMEATQEMASCFAGGAAFAGLAPLETWEGIVPALAQALDFKPVADPGERRSERQQLLDYLQDKELLLLLDNFEHLLDGAPLLVEILAASPRSKLLVTSRERLKLQAERVYPIRGLAFSRWTTVDEARRDPAVRLFVQRGQQVRAGFALRAGHLGSLQRILQSVQGMPLAIILAAAWLDVFRPVEIAAELERSLDFLEAGFQDLPPRQRSMRAVFDSTWARLSERDRALFAALSVFRGGFSVAAVMTVAGAEPRDLRRLVGRSLLEHSEG